VLQSVKVANSPPVRLLVVDDIADNRTVLSRLFRLRDFDVVEANNGAAALALLTEQSFDAVLLDVVMPTMDGFETLKRIRAVHSLSSLPVIMVTARVESEDIVRALELGANDYIAKPFDFAIALARVQSQLVRQRAERALAYYVEQLESTNRQLEREIAERKQSEARVRYLALHDALTGLGNRSYFRDRLVEALRTRQCDVTPALLFIDLDQFKLINDTLGHRIGDLLLAAIGERLKAAVGDSDKVARLGGDEFAVIHCCRERDDASRLAASIMAALAVPYDIEGHQLFAACSIGIAYAADDGNDPDLLLSNADLALFRAKASGRNSYCFFEPEMNAHAQARRLLESELRKGLECAQFEIHYQPLLDLKSTRISGFEALLRWNHPERGLISPLEFVSLAEDTGLIVPLSRWVLLQACRQATAWPGDVKVAINLSPVQFRGGSLVQDVVDALATSQLEPGRLELEITESALLDNNKETLQALHQLRSMGVRIAMDDFGTGYSSLSYLRKFPFDKIKIDRTFIRDLLATKDNAAIVRAIIGLANSVGMHTTAEGVETEEQFSYLKAEGCAEVQGYFISRPLPAKDLASLLQRSNETALKVA
jgi:diguanylate cyclase (GGDEF)-like protein